jgi:MFS superfamily sulfate permease-like transporter
MIHYNKHYYLQHLKDDLPSGLVVFLVALPLCLGVALASGAPLFSGLIAGIIGGLVVAWLSGSQLSVSGPAAGLTVIVYNAINELGSFQGLLVACVLAGIMQYALGHFKAGILGSFFPGSVIEGMMAAIGLILIIKQIPHATGYDASFEGDESYMMETAESSYDELLTAFDTLSPGATLITLVSLLVLYAWDSKWIKQKPWLHGIPAPLIVVVWGVVFNLVCNQFFPEFTVNKHLVNLPIYEQTSDILKHLTRPDFSYLANLKVYKVAFTIAVIASVETLLSLEATDKMDPLKRAAPTNQELKAQGIGNIFSGLLGGLPVTAVIVRSSVNINAGAKTSMSAFMHGLLLLVSVLFLTEFLNEIPLSCLSAILLFTGYKLAKPSLFKSFYLKGMNQFLPFIITVVSILLADLLVGITIGIVVGLGFVIRANFHAAITLTQNDSHYVLTLNKDVSFINKALLRKFIGLIEDSSTVVIDASKASFIDHDILEILDDFIATAHENIILVEVIDLHGKESLDEDHQPFVVIKERSDAVG